MNNRKLVDTEVALKIIQEISDSFLYSYEAEKVLELMRVKNFLIFQEEVINKLESTINMREK
jgi:hypothetical protein